MYPIPFASQSYQNRSLPVSAQRCFNLYPEIIDQQIVLHGTPGLKVFADSLTSEAVRGLKVMGSLLYAVIGGGLYSVAPTGVVTKIGNITGTTLVSMSTTGTELSISTGAGGYIYDGTTLSSISDVDYPVSSTSAFINQRIIYESTFGFTYSELDDAGTMSGTVNGTGDPDNAVAVLVDHLEVWLFGAKSTEVWYNSGDSVTPFERLAGAFLEVGCGAKHSPAKLDNSVYWLGNDWAVYRANGYSPERISTSAIEYAIKGYTNKTGAIAFAYTEEGHSFYQLTFPSAKKTWVYDSASNRWHERGSITAGRHRANCYVYAFGRHLVGDYDNGIIYEMSLDTYLDGDETIQRIAISPPLNQNGETVFLSKIWIDVESGGGLTTGQGSDPQAMLNHSDDGGRTWSNERWRTMGKVGEYFKRSIWRRCGSFKSRIYRLVISDPIKVAIIGAHGE